MKRDFTFFCRIWIGIAYASGERVETLIASLSESFECTKVFRGVDFLIAVFTNLLLMCGIS